MAQFSYQPAPLIPWYDICRTLKEHADASIRCYKETLKLHSRMVRIRSGTLRELGLTHARLRVLAVVAATANLSISQIARELDLSRQAVHRVVHDLEHARMLLIDTPTHNRRSRRVRMASLGRHIAALALPWERDWTSLVLDGLRIHELNEGAARSRLLRSKLPWTVTGPDDYALIFEREPNPQRLCLLR